MFFWVYSVGLDATEYNGYLKHEQNVRMATKIIIVVGLVLMVE